MFYNNLFKNINKNDMAKKTIKQLEDEIETLNQNKSHWYNKFTELEEEKDRQQNNKIFSLENEKTQLLNQVGNLMEIIRWHINPQTAESPFLPVKSQRDDNRRNY